MSGMHDSLIKEKVDGFKEANSAASRPAERDHKKPKQDEGVLSKNNTNMFLW